MTDTTDTVDTTDTTNTVSNSVQDTTDTADTPTSSTETIQTISTTGAGADLNETSNSNLGFYIIAGVIGVMAGSALILTVITLMIVLLRKNKRKKMCDGKMTANPNPDVTITGINTTDEDYVHYSLPSNYRSTGLRGLAADTASGKGGVSLSVSKPGLFSSSVAKDSRSNLSIDLQDNLSYTSQNSVDLQDRQSHLNIDLQDNLSYTSHNSADLQDRRSHLNIDLQDNRSYNSLDLPSYHSHYSIDLQDNQSYSSIDPRNPIGPQDNPTRQSDSDEDMHDNYSYNRSDFFKH